MRVDVRIYLVTGDVGDRQLPDVVAAAAAGGATIVQLRDKSGDTSAVRDMSAALSAVLRDTGVPLVVNDDAETAYASGTAGVHLGPDDPHPRQARELLGESAIIGWSVHDLAQLTDGEALEACDYLAASPVWSTPTKPDTTAPMGLDGVVRLRAQMPARLPLVAIGGIDETNAASVIEAGADGISIVSAICSAPDPEAAARRLRVIVDEALADRRAG